MKYRVVRQFACNIDPQREDVYRVETEPMMTQREAVELMKRLDALLDIKPGNMISAVDRLYDEVTQPGAVPSFEADEVILFTLRRIFGIEKP